MFQVLSLFGCFLLLFLRAGAFDLEAALGLVNGGTTTPAPTSNQSFAARYNRLWQRISFMVELLNEECQGRDYKFNVTDDTVDSSLESSVSSSVITDSWYRKRVRLDTALLQRLKRTYRSCVNDTLRPEQPVNDIDIGCRLSTEVTNLAYSYRDTDIYSGYSGSYRSAYMSYRKENCHTDVRVQVYGSVEVDSDGESCSRFQVYFNDKNCTDPGPIEFINYRDGPIRERIIVEIDGICRGLNSGPLSISLHNVTCLGWNRWGSTTATTTQRDPYYNRRQPSYNSRSTMPPIYTPSWHGEVRMIVYEADRRAQFKQACPGLSVFNVKQNASLLDDGSDVAGHMIRTLAYNKTDNSSSVYVKYSSVAAVISHSEDFNYCGRWYVTFNGEECSNPAPIDMVIRPTINGGGSYKYKKESYRHYSMHGICRDLPEGPLTIDVRIGPCNVTRTAPRADMVSGWKSWSRLITQEVRENLPIKEVKGWNGEMIQLPMLNVAHHAWMNINSDLDEGIIKIVNYTKTSNDTGLRLLWMGNHRHYAIGESCSRWYFTINGAECSNPGTVSATSYYNKEIDYYHPAVVSGTCHGVPAGLHSIAYKVGKCPSYDLHDSYTGWQSSSRMIIMEAQGTQ